MGSDHNSFIIRAALLLVLVGAGVQCAAAGDGYRLVAAWGGEGSGDGQFNESYGVAVDAAGRVCVADSLNYRVQKFTSTGGFVSA